MPSINPGVLWSEWLALGQESAYEEVRMYRDFYDGNHDVEMSKKQQDFLLLRPRDIVGLNNLMPIPINSLAERLTVVGFDVSEDPATSSLLGEMWEARGWGNTADDIHLAALRDGDSYLLVEWDEESGAPRLSFEPTYDGSNGALMVYDDEYRTPIYGIKAWRSERDGTTKANVYYPDRAEKWTTANGQWAPRIDVEGEPWPLPLVDRLGKPLGLPLFHFRNNPCGNDYGRSEIRDVIGLQRLLIRRELALQAATDAAGFPIRTLTGDIPDERMVSSARNIWYSAKSDATWGTLPPGDLTHLRGVVDDTVLRIAQVTRTPLRYFLASKQVPSAETQEAEDSAIISRAEDRAQTFGVVWAGVARMALRLMATYGSERALPDSVGIRTIWGGFARINPTRLESERATILSSYLAAGMSPAGVVGLESLGFSADEQEALLRGDFEMQEGEGGF